MGRKVKPWAATHFVEKETWHGKEIFYIKDGVSCWLYWNDAYFDWYRWDSRDGIPKPLPKD